MNYASDAFRRKFIAFGVVIFLALSFLNIDFASAENQDSRACEAALVPKAKKPERTWNFVQSATPNPTFDWLSRPLDETLKGLSMFKRFKLKRLLKNFNSDTDFLFFENTDFFVAELVEIFEDGVIANDQNRSTLTRLATHKLLSQGIVNSARALKVEDARFIQKFRLFLAKYRLHPLMQLLTSPYQFPVWRTQPMADDTIAGLFENQSVSELNATESSILRDNRNRSRYGTFRRISNRLLTSALLFMFATSAKDAIREYPEKFDQSTTAAWEQYQNEKSKEYEDELKHLQELESKRQELNQNPVAYFQKLVKAEFVKQMGRNPASAEEITEIERVAQQLAAEFKSRSPATPVQY